MAVKLIAVDMDGTFLNSEKGYNKERFSKIFKRMKEQGIRFVCASGNQFPQLQQYLGEYENEMTFIAENGAYILEEGMEVDSALMDFEVVNKAIHTLEGYGDVPFILCGKKAGYVHTGIPEEYYQLFSKYYHSLEQVTDFDSIDDEMFKFATAFQEDEVPKVLEYLHGELGGSLIPVASGYGFVDLIQPGIHKGRGINILQNKWGISKEESAAFGDSPNDIEMLQEVKYSYVMSNGNPEVKKIARYEIGDHNTESLLDTLEELLERK
ncbi:Cof-type HAD-IIB family hydrolase [Jeotgalibaca ciconiae]|uniref:HAD family hydrolase n=1 Tax=Jeotgalibaca ciconiae TaxID=2496265 RepID=A0A3Q9BL10_9LACT|nr:Cof-type HAD-IIB family hydrolase [Jeotgalibaca ciconiae]AZP03450.1 HAD family hydrolase [Jeotgalibaca ciconiae]HJB24942.1 Cof-type HAD-IIB family hydrolase [Candidatus Jeotgalibaca pullicola]